MEKGNNDDFLNYKRLKILETKLDTIYDKRSKGSQIKSKVKWIQEGEKNSTYF